jgi:hypothetical protein
MEVNADTLTGKEACRRFFRKGEYLPAAAETHSKPQTGGEDEGSAD